MHERMHTTHLEHTSLYPQLINTPSSDQAHFQLGRAAPMAPRVPVCSAPFCTSNPQPLRPGPCCCWLSSLPAAAGSPATLLQAGPTWLLNLAITDSFKEGKRREERRERKKWEEEEEKRKSLPFSQELTPASSPHQPKQHVALVKILDDYATEPKSLRRTASLPITPILLDSPFEMQL